MLPRKSRRRRDTGPMFPFGEIMLPVIGLVALGILIIAVKMFFMPTGEDKAYKNIPEKVVEEEIRAEQAPSRETVKPGGNETVSAKAEDKKKEEAVRNNDNAVAVPVSGGSASENLGDNKRTVSSTPSVTEGQDEKSVPKPARSNYNAAGSDSDWGVQIGSFREASAARSLSEKVRNSGYSVKIEKTEVNGTEYNRVIVLAGETRNNALQVEKKLKGSGYPTYVRRVK